ASRRNCKRLNTPITLGYNASAHLYSHGPRAITTDGNGWRHSARNDLQAGTLLRPAGDSVVFPCPGRHGSHGLANSGCVRRYDFFLYNSTGPVIIYFGLGYVPAARWFKIGFLISLFHLGIWLGIGLPYWKWLGWW
ncbi:MAG: anion permease, partial [Pirellulales bacterium]